MFTATTSYKTRSSPGGVNNATPGSAGGAAAGGGSGGGAGRNRARSYMTAYAAQDEREVGRYKLHPVYTYLETAWFQPFEE
jgi:hypothetical protein